MLAGDASVPGVLLVDGANAEHYGPLDELFVELKATSFVTLIDQRWLAAPIASFVFGPSSKFVSREDRVPASYPTMRNKSPPVEWKSCTVQQR